jgi:TadE-like protein
MAARASRIRRPSRWRRQRGSATVELAAAIPLLVAVTLAMVGVVGIARDQVLAQGAAREGAREAAVGGDRARAAAAAARRFLPAAQPGCRSPRPARDARASAWSCPPAAVRGPAGARACVGRGRSRAGPTTHPGRPVSADPRQAARGSVTLVGLALTGFVLLAGVLAVDVGALAAARAALRPPRTWRPWPP